VATDPLNPEVLARAALRYLERFDSSVANLRRVLLQRFRKQAREQAIDMDRAAQLIDELLERYQSSNLLNDERYARSIAAGLRARGKSRRAIVAKLRGRGIAAGIADAAVAKSDEASGDAEFAAAVALVRKKRLGPHRPEEEREAERRRDLSRLARAGFSFDVAKRALRADEIDDAF
jgi:regulatory protein